MRKFGVFNCSSEKFILQTTVIYRTSLLFNDHEYITNDSPDADAVEMLRMPMTVLCVPPLDNF